MCSSQQLFLQSGRGRQTELRAKADATAPPAGPRPDQVCMSVWICVCFTQWVWISQNDLDIEKFSSKRVIISAPKTNKKVQRDNLVWFFFHSWCKYYWLLSDYISTSRGVAADAYGLPLLNNWWQYVSIVKSLDWRNFDPESSLMKNHCWCTLTIRKPYPTISLKPI